MSFNIDVNLERGLIPLIVDTKFHPPKGGKVWPFLLIELIFEQKWAYSIFFLILSNLHINHLFYSSFTTNRPKKFLQTA